MKTKPLPNDLAGLVAIAEAVAAVLAERQAELGISTDLEALLRASVAATTYAADMYVAVLSGANKSQEAAAFVAEAKRRRDRSIQQLRQRITRSMQQLRRQMRNRDFRKIADFVAR
jgi:hypothetical protein